MTPRESHSKFSSFQQKIENKYLPKVIRVIKRTVDKFIRAGMQDVNSIDLKDLYPVLNNMYYQCGYGYGWSIYKECAKLKAVNVVFSTKKMGDEIITPGSIAEEVMAVLRLSLVQNVNEMESSLKTRILAIIQQGLVNGWGYEKTAQLVADQAGIFRARRIVRTESVKASNLSGMIGAKKTGLLMDKRWVSARDSRVRGNPGGKYPNAQFDHWYINGEVVGMDRPFTGTGEPMMYPGDPKGAAGDIINCRCSCSFVPKRDANGRLIRIRPGAFSSQVAMMWPV